MSCYHTSMQHVLGQLFQKTLRVTSRHCRSKYCPGSYVTCPWSHCALFSSKANENSTDFFGITESEENSDILENEEKVHSKSLHDKYIYRSSKPEQYAKFKNVSYGIVRFDSVGHPKRNKQKANFSHRGKQKDLESANFVNDSRNFDNSTNNHRKDNRTSFEQSQQKHRFNDSRQNRSQMITAKEVDDMNFVDSQYFSALEVTENVCFSTSRNTSESKLLKRETIIDGNEANFIDGQYFSKTFESSRDDDYLPRSRHERDDTKTICAEDSDNMNFVDQQYFKKDQQSNSTETFIEGILEKQSVQSGSEKYENTEVSEQKQQRALNNKGSSPKSAYEVALKIRQNMKNHGNDSEIDDEQPRLYSGSVDSKGFRVLKSQVADMMNTPSNMVVKLLKDSIIYDRDDIIAIEKPYGLPSHGGPGVHMSVGQLLPALTRLVDPSGQTDTLHLVHRLDRQTTGVMLLARTPETAWKLHEAFRKRNVIKKYWVLTKGVPSPEHGIIDIPLAEGSVGHYYRMVLKPERTDDTRLVLAKSTVETHQAITEYTVLDSRGSAALVECTPVTGVKHQIRAHLAFALNTPVLGDHKYSHVDKMAPQRLYPDILHRLGIRQSKVRHLPMMLHAKSLMLPEFSAGRNVFISCRLPKHFTVNMNRLKLKPPRNV